MEAKMKDIQKIWQQLVKSIYYKECRNFLGSFKPKIKYSPF